MKGILSLELRILHALLGNVQDYEDLSKSTQKDFLCSPLKKKKKRAVKQNPVLVREQACTLCPRAISKPAVRALTWKSDINSC